MENKYCDTHVVLLLEQQVQGFLYITDLLQSNIDPANKIYFLKSCHIFAIYVDASNMLNCNSIIV